VHHDFFPLGRIFDIDLDIGEVKWYKGREKGQNQFMKVYLSIDLDYWNRGPRCFGHMKGFLKQALGYVSKSRVHVMDSHENMTLSINESGCDELINMDWHSDISNRFDPEFKDCKEWNSFNCGTWVTYIDWKDKGKYTWIHPYDAKYRNSRGYCHVPVGRKKHNPFNNVVVSGWKATEQRKHQKPEDIIPWSFVDSIGIAFSYDWINSLQLAEIAGNILGYKPEADKNAKLF